MSVARVHVVQRAAKDQGKCERDGTPLPKGSTYRWFKVGFRSRYKHVRCMNPQCTPRPSELESSLLSSVYAAQESAQDTLDALRGSELGDASDIIAQVEAARDDVVQALDDVIEQYRGQDEAFGGQGTTQGAERADELESARDTMSDWQADNDEPDYPDDDEPDVDADPDAHDDWADARAEAWTTWLDEVLDSASDAINELGV